LAELSDQASRQQLGTAIVSTREERGKVYSNAGLDHGVGHSLLLLYDAKPSHGQKIKEFNGLDHYLPNASIDLF